MQCDRDENYNEVKYIVVRGGTDKVEAHIKMIALAKGGAGASNRKHSELN